jgi:hypothetical protein
LILNRKTRDALSDGLRGVYSFLTDFGLYPETQIRDRVAQLAQDFGIREFQLYDWFATYSQPTNGSSWLDPFKRERLIYRQTIQIYIDEIHRRGGRAWAYVQAVAADEDNLADSGAEIYRLIDQRGNWVSHPPESPRFWAYFLNGAWADRMTRIWGPQVKELGFDGIHWDTLGARAGEYTAEVSGTHAFLRRAKENLAPLELSQTMNFVDLAWWDAGLVASGAVAFPYAEVWTMSSERTYYVAMEDKALAQTWGVIAFYPEQDKPPGWTDSKVMLARWAEAPEHRLVYLIVGDNEKRLTGPYFPDAIPLNPDEKEEMLAKLPKRASQFSQAILSTPTVRSQTFEFDVFLCHNSEEKEEVRDLNKRLKALSIRTWLDEEQATPRRTWQEALEAQIPSIKSAIVCVGEKGEGPWQQMERRGLIEEFARRKIPVIPVILRNCKQEPKLPFFLSQVRGVDLRSEFPDPLMLLEWGITGKRPEF